MSQGRSGRPRTFDREAALRTALELFWARGYEGVSIEDLTSAMGISRPSLYAAFGDKRTLFHEVVRLYETSEGKVIAELLAAPVDTRTAIRNLLLVAAEGYTRGGPRRALGCLVSTGLLGSALENEDVANLLRERRRLAREALADRIKAGIGRGDVPVGTDCEALASFFAGVLQGIAIQARDGAPLQGLQSIADLAIKAWPETEKRPHELLPARAGR